LHPRPRVLFITPEFDDFVRVGGLAAVSAALPRSLRQGCDIRVILPGYRSVLKLTKTVELVGHCEARAALPACSVGRLQTDDGLTVYVVLCPTLYEREGNPYGDATGRDFADNDLRFARFASCAVALGAGLIDRSWSADILHANDWPAALVPAYAAWDGVQLPSILTIHNLAYQGLFSPQTLARIGAPPQAFDINGVEFFDQVSFLKGGIVYATHLTTVSETYAREITTPALGCGLDGLLRSRADKAELTGILNGIDESWDPRTCKALIANFAAGDWAERQRNAEHVRKRFKLAVARGPLFGLVSRLVHQKGVDFVIETAEEIVQAGGQIVVTGTGEPQFETALTRLQERHPESIGVTIGFDPNEARTIYAGSDFTLMPSRFEPCGLSQMYAQRFGSLPIGCRTGGLAETIEDGKTGILFDTHSLKAFIGAVSRAFDAFADSPSLDAMRRNAMARSYGWGGSATVYVNLYSRLAA
jgi:starch synthase